MEKFGAYRFKIVQNITQPLGYFYVIFNDDDTVLREAKEVFEYEGIARFAAIGHISMLEQGKG